MESNGTVKKTIDYQLLEEDVSGTQGDFLMLQDVTL